MTRAPNWTDHGDRLTRTYRFGSFAAAIGFMTEAAFHCERVDHHPDWRNVHARIDVTLTTHDAGGVTDRDIALAAFLDALAARRAG